MFNELKKRQKEVEESKKKEVEIEKDFSKEDAKA